MRRAAQSADGPSSGQGSTNSEPEEAGNGTEKAPKELVRPSLLHEKITGSIISAFFAVYNNLDFAFLESVYCSALVIELRRLGHKVGREVSVPIFYDGQQIARYRVDFMVDELIVIEVKSTELLNPNASRLLLNCLRATRLEVGLLLHFGPKPKHFRLFAPNTDRP